MARGSHPIEKRYSGRIGERVGDLAFVSISQARGDRGRVLGVFECLCGNITVQRLARTLQGKGMLHCGCKTDRGKHRTHGMRDSSEYRSWISMKGRCLNPGNKDFPGWGGKGITIFDGWINSFEDFFKHVGPKPNGMTLDRIDNTKGYEPGNVRWATASEQLENTRNSWLVEIDGKKFSSQSKAAQHFGVTIGTIADWCAGHTDHRRLHHSSGGYTSPRRNCKRWKKYG